MNILNIASTIYSVYYRINNILWFFDLPKSIMKVPSRGSHVLSNLDHRLEAGSNLKHKQYF